MTLQKFLKDNNINLSNGCFKYKIPNKRMKKFINQFRYIDTYIYWFDDEENKDEFVWIDIEGMDYGWIWITCKKRKNNRLSYRKSRKKIINFAMEGIFDYSKDKIFTIEIDGVTYIYLESKDEKSINLIRISNKKLNVYS